MVVVIICPCSVTVLVNVIGGEMLIVVTVTCGSVDVEVTVETIVLGGSCVVKVCAEPETVVVVTLVWGGRVMVLTILDTSVVV